VIGIIGAHRQPPGLSEGPTVPAAAERDGRIDQRTYRSTVSTGSQPARRGC
jgi:hypothetical protein